MPAPAAGYRISLTVGFGLLCWQAYMAKNLVIVESPAKARTLARYLGADFEVKSSYGHIRDLPKRDLGVDLEKNFEPTYQVPADKKKVVSELKRAAKGREVWLASDEDREGEAIAWHICYLLGLDPVKVRRIVFHEITESAIKNAVRQPRAIDQKLVDAQQARRVLDRLVGYELSPVLWKKVRPGLSAGRVQSVAVRLIVEREREIRAFEPVRSYKVTAVLTAANLDIEAELSEKLAEPKLVEELFKAYTTANFKVADIDKKPGQRSPAAPFTTSTLQQTAASRLGFGVRQTMRLAQRLYENGHITYMRTDSTTLSQLALDASKDLITKSYGANYYHHRQYRTKSRSAQEAHEAIRPTNLTRESAGDDVAEAKLYRLIRQRTLASQMSPAEIEKTTVNIKVSNHPMDLVASGEVLKFDGYLKVYGGGKDDRIIPELKVGQELKLVSADALEGFSRAAARYSEASLVRKLEELGIGRPSTYAPTISVVQDRGYVEKTDVTGKPTPVRHYHLENGEIKQQTDETMVGADRNKLLPTDLGEQVTDFLVKYFSQIVEYEFTAKAEEELDAVADGQQEWHEMIKKFYSLFHPLIEKSADISRAEAAQAREIGVHPDSGEPIIARFARYGPVLQLGASPDPKDKEAKKPRFAPMPDGATIETVTMEQALPMFNLPRSVGKTADGQEILADIGPYGPYLKVDKRFISLKDHDPLTISEADAQAVIDQHAEAHRQKNIADFGGIKVLHGPYGPYITDGKKNARIPKDTDPETIDEDQAKQLLAKAPEKKAFRRKRRK